MATDADGAAVAVEGIDPVTGGRSLENARVWLHAHLDEGGHPFNAIDVDTARQVVDGLAGLDPETWAAAWLDASHRFVRQAEAAQTAAGDRAIEREAWWQAYQFAFIARYPTPVHPAKERAYEESVDYFQRAVALDDPAVERIAVPFAGGDREGRDEVVFYLGRPRESATPAPVVLLWGGIDMWKEESYVRSQRLRDSGVATIHIDMPGVGEAPVYASTTAERMWDPVFEWIARSDLDERRVAAIGHSYGGYWATKLAHTHRDRLRAAVNWGGGIHLTFQPEWQQRSRSASTYLMDLGASRARIFGERTFDEYIARCPQLSLLDQGVLDQPCCDLLLVNGKDDRQNDARDIHLALEHGDPKSARMFPGGHMGVGPVAPTVMKWVADRIR